MSSSTTCSEAVPPTGHQMELPLVPLGDSNLLQYSDASRKEAIKLIKALENYLPSHLYCQVEFSFQFPQSNNINDFKTYNYNKQENCFELVDAVKKTEQGYLTKHTHLTRDTKKLEDGPLYYGYNYIH